MVDNRRYVLYTMPVSRQSLRWFFFCFIGHQMIDMRRLCSAIHTIRIIPSTIPRMEQKILCSTFLEAALRFTRTQRTKRPLRSGAQGKEEMPTDKKAADRLRKEYPNHVSLSVAAPYLGVSPRQLSWPVAEGRQPFASIGGNVGTRQRYVRIYTEPLIALLSSEAYNF